MPLLLPTAHHAPDCAGDECAPACRYMPPDLAPADAEEAQHDFIGKLQPNYFCRAWNEKRGKYCGQRAGRGTSHSGRGRCKDHGGNLPMKHGQRTGDIGRYANIQHESIRQKLAAFEADLNPLNVERELILARALLEDFIERHAAFEAALLAWYDSFKASGRQMASDDLQLLTWLAEEFEATSMDQYENGDGERAKRKLDRIKIIINRLGVSVDEGRPRRVTDIADARHLIETIRGLVESIQRHKEETHISRANFFRFNAEMGRAVDEVLRKHLAPDVAARIGAEIGEKWLGVRLPV